MENNPKALGSYFQGPIDPSLLSRMNMLNQGSVLVFIRHLSYTEGFFIFFPW